MAVCALTMLDGMEDEVTAAGGVLLLALALVLAWLSTHVADRGDHILGTILTVGAHASLIGLGGQDSYSAGPPGGDAPEQQAASPSQENKPDDGEPAGSNRSDSESGAVGAGPDLLLDIQSKQAGRLRQSQKEEEEGETEDDDDEDDQTVIKCTGGSTPDSGGGISVRLKFLNDTEEVALVEPQDTVGGLKR